MRYKSLKLTVGLAVVAFLIAVIPSGRVTLAQEVNEDILGQDQIEELCDEVAGVEVLPDGSLGEIKVCETSALEDRCATVGEIEIDRDLPGLDQIRQMAGIAACDPQQVVSQGIRAASGFFFNGIEVDPETISVPASHTSPFIDSDFDGLRDDREADYGLSPDNGFDWLDHVRDCVIDAADAQAVAFRWNTTSSSPIYALYYDREVVDGVISPGDGVIDINDLQMVFNQFGRTCGDPAAVPPTAQSVCNQLATEAYDEGVDNFYCSTNPLPTHVEVSVEGDFNKIAQVKVHSYRDTEIKTISNTLMDVFYGEPAGEPPTDIPEGEIASYHSEICEEVICTINANASWSWRILGLTCAEFTFFQSFKIYYPWKVVIDVTTPIAGASSSAPCSHSNVHMDWDSSDLPFSSSLTAGVDIQAGIPFLGNLFTFRSWSFEVYFWFDGYFNTETIITD